MVAGSRGTGDFSGGKGEATTANREWVLVFVHLCL